MTLFKSFLLCIISVWSFASKILSFEEKYNFEETKISNETIISAIKSFNVKFCFILFMKYKVDLANIKIDDLSAFDYVFDKAVKRITAHEKKEYKESGNINEVKLAALIKFSDVIKRTYDVYMEDQQIIIPTWCCEKIVEKAITKIRNKKKDQNNLFEDSLSAANLGF